jgi:hypothetical protein
MLARNHGEQTVGRRPLGRGTVQSLVGRGLVRTYQKTVIGVTLTKVALTKEGWEIVGGEPPW